MERFNKSAGAAGAPVAPAAPVNKYFTEGNPGGGIPATVPGEWWFHMMTEELRAVIIEGGLVPAHNTLTQVRDAIKNIVGAVDYKASVRAASTAPINLAAPGANIDGVAMVAGDRFLEKDNATGANRGIYIWNGAAVAATRSSDADTGAEFNGGAMIPVEEGTVNADTRWQLTNDGAVIIGTTALTFAQINAPNTDTSVQGSFRNLKANAGGTAATVNITADEITLGDETGAFQTLRTWNGTITTTAAGANGLDTGAIAASTWYYIFAIAKADGTKGFLASLSATAPTMPATYTKWARLGAFRTDGTANKYPLSFTQANRNVEYKVAAATNVTALPIAITGASGNTTTPTYTAVALGTFIPPTAGAVDLVIVSNASGIGLIAPNPNHGPNGTLTNPAYYGEPGNGGNTFAGKIRMVLQSMNFYYASAAGRAAFVAGWEDNL